MYQIIKNIVQIGPVQTWVPYAPSAAPAYLYCIMAGLSTSVLSQTIPAGLRTMYRMMAAMYAACERMIMSDIS